VAWFYPRMFPVCTARPTTPMRGSLYMGQVPVTGPFAGKDPPDDSNPHDPTPAAVSESAKAAFRFTQQPR